MSQPTPTPRPSRSRIRSDADIRRIHAYCIGVIRDELDWRLADIIHCANEPNPQPWEIISLVKGCQSAIAELSSLKEGSDE